MTSSKYNTPTGIPAFGEGPRNLKVPQEVVDSYNALVAKFAGNLSQRQSITQADFDAVSNALRTSKAEPIKPGEVYLGPGFKDVQGNLLRDRPDSVFNPEKIAQAQAEAESASEAQATDDGRSRAGRERKFTAAELKERRKGRKETIDQRKARRAAKAAKQFRRSMARF